MSDLKAFWAEEQWFLAKIVLPIALLLLSYQFIFYPMLQNVEQTRKEIATLSAQTFSEEWFTQQINTLDSQIIILDEAYTLLDGRVVGDSVPGYSEKGFRKLAEKIGLTVQKVKESSKPVEGSNHHVVSLSLTGSYRYFIRYLYAIETKRPLSVVTRFSIKKKKGKYAISGMHIEYLKK
ncbi:MAG: hypothetical protein OCD01_01340 [Fibrobacterales bacterium]